MLGWPRSAEHRVTVLIPMAAGRRFAPAAGEKPWTNGILPYSSFPSLKDPRPLVSSADSCQRSWIHHPTLPAGITSGGSWLSEQEHLQAVPFYIPLNFQQLFLEWAQASNNYMKRTTNSRCRQCLGGLWPLVGYTKDRQCRVWKMKGLSAGKIRTNKVTLIGTLSHGLKR